MCSNILRGPGQLKCTRKKVKKKGESCSFTIFPEESSVYHCCVHSCAQPSRRDTKLSSGGFALILREIERKSSNPYSFRTFQSAVSNLCMLSRALWDCSNCIWGKTHQCSQTPHAHISCHSYSNPRENLTKSKVDTSDVTHW